MVIGERIRMRALPEEPLLRHLDLGDLDIGGFILILEVAAIFLALLALRRWCGHYWELRVAVVGEGLG